TPTPTPRRPYPQDHVRLTCRHRSTLFCSVCWKLRDYLAGESLELLQVVAAGGEHHVLDAGALEIGDALDDLAGGAQEVRLLEVLERAVRAHDALDVRALERERFLAVGGVHEM